MDPNDPRAVRSRQALIDTFIDLALEQGYDNLTVRALTKQAGVGYATFFRQYKSLDELLLAIVQNTYQALHKRMSLQLTVYDEAIALYRFISEYPSIFRLYFSLPETNPVRQVLIVESKKFISSRCKPRSSTSAPLELSVEHILATTNRLVNWYLDHLTEYTPEQLADIHFDFIIAGTQTAVSIVQHEQSHAATPLP